MSSSEPSRRAVEAAEKIRVAAERIGAWAACWQANRYARGRALAAEKRGNRRPDDDVVLVKLSAGRSTYRRPGESWAEAMNRLTEGHDL